MSPQELVELRLPARPPTALNADSTVHRVLSHLGVPASALMFAGRSSDAQDLLLEITPSAYTDLLARSQKAIAFDALASLPAPGARVIAVTAAGKA